MHGSPLFDEPVAKWMHGPVVPVLFQAFEQYGAESLPVPQGVDFSKYPDKVRELLDEVHTEFGQFSAWKLGGMTRGEPPWFATELGADYRLEDLTTYFKAQLVNG